MLARENTLDDIRAIRAAVPALGLETFVHGALCISYSGQCFMSGMISERSANRGSCAQSCRKDYVLTDVTTREELDRGYLISAKDLGAYDHLAAIAEAGIGCLKVEGRKKKPEYVATVTKAYRDFLDRVESGDTTPPTVEEVEPLVQIFSRGFTGGMYGGRDGRDYVTRTQPDNRGITLGTVVGYERGELIVDVSAPLQVGDGLGFEPPNHVGGPTTGFSVTAVRTLGTRGNDASGARDAHARRRGLARRAHVARRSCSSARARATRRSRRRFAPGSRASTFGCSAQRARRSRPCSSPTARRDGAQRDHAVAGEQAPARRRRAARSVRPTRRHAVRARRPRHDRRSRRACSFP